MKKIKYYGILLASGWLALTFSSQAFAENQEGYQKLDVPDQATFEESYFTANKMHMYLGIGSLVAAGLAGMTAPDAENPAVVAQQKRSTNTTHYYLGTAAAALGGAAVVSGLMLHLDDIQMNNGVLDPDTLHMVLTMLGTAGYVYAVSKGPRVIGGPSNGHAAAGMAGAALMATGIAFEW